MQETIKKETFCLKWWSWHVKRRCWRPRFRGTFQRGWDCQKKKKKAKCVVPWSYVLFHDCNFLNFVLCFIFNQVTFFTQIYIFLCDYKFFVLQLIETWIQQLLCFHICQFGIFSKLDNFFVLKFPNFHHFAFKFLKKFAISVFYLIYTKFDHKGV